MTTLGGFALAPYAASFTYHGFKEEFLRRRAQLAYFVRQGENAQTQLEQVRTDNPEIFETSEPDPNQLEMELISPAVLTCKGLLSNL